MYLVEVFHGLLGSRGCSAAAMHSLQHLLLPLLRLSCSPFAASQKVTIGGCTPSAFWFRFHDSEVLSLTASWICLAAAE